MRPPAIQQPFLILSCNPSPASWLMLMGFFEGIFGKKQPQIALFVDGPNIIRRQLNIDLREIKKKVSEHGNIRIARIYLDQFASDKLIEAMVNQGFEPKITTGDVDVTMAVEATEQMVNPEIDIIAMMTRDTDFIPALTKAKERGKKTLVVGIEPGFSVALRNTADILIMINAEEVSRERTNPERGPYGTQYGHRGDQGRQGHHRQQPLQQQKPAHLLQQKSEPPAQQKPSEQKPPSPPQEGP